MDNRGFSLLELIVTVLITAIFTTVVIVNVSYYSTANTTACVKKLTSAIEKTRLETMSRTGGSVKLRIYFNESEQNYIAEITYNKTEGGVVTEEKLNTYQLCSDSLKIYVAKYNVNETSEIGLREIRETGECILSFNKRSGVYLPDSDGLFYSRITVNGSKNESVILVKDTGRAYIE